MSEPSAPIVAFPAASVELVIPHGELAGVAPGNQYRVPGAVTCVAAPVQAEGSLPDGMAWYFRARHDRLYLGIGRNPDGAVGSALAFGQGAETVAFVSFTVGGILMPGRPVDARHPLSSFGLEHIPPLVAWMLDILDYRPGKWGQGDALVVTETPY